MFYGNDNMKGVTYPLNDGHILSPTCGFIWAFLFKKKVPSSDNVETSPFHFTGKVKAPVVLSLLRYVTWAELQYFVTQKYVHDKYNLCQY